MTEKEYIINLESIEASFSCLRNCDLEALARIIDNTLSLERVKKNYEIDRRLRYQKSIIDAAIIFKRSVDKSLYYYSQISDVATMTETRIQ